MKDEPLESQSPLSLSVEGRVDHLCDLYESACLAGQRPLLEDFLHGKEEPERSALLPELLRLLVHYVREEQRRLWQQGERPAVEAYLQEDPLLGKHPECVWELVCHELTLREQRGEMPRLEDYLRRFPTHEVPLRRYFAARQALPLSTVHRLGEPDTVQPAQPPLILSDPDRTGPWQAEPAPVRPPGDAGTPEVPGYRLESELGRGGMGVVYRARQLSTQRVVALKIILAGGQASPEEFQRFQREMEIVAHLDHPHLVPLYEAGIHEGQPYYSMQLVEGESLAKQVRRFTQDFRAAARLLASAGRAVHYAHQRGILHRDLKPANILLDAAGEPHVTDFGLARRLEGEDHLTQSGVLLGTILYMAPEQAASSRDVSTSADVYSLGVVLYELLTGKPPFKAENPLETLRQIRCQKPVRPRVLNRGVPRDLETICLKCLEKEPSRRYSSAEALADDLQRWLDGEPILARPVRLPERLWKWARRNADLATLVILLVAVALSSAAVVGWQSYADASAKRKLTELTASIADPRDYRETLYKALALSSSDREGAVQLLDGCKPEMRGVEWHFLQEIYRSRVWVIKGSGGVDGVVVSPDGRRLATWTTNGQLTVYDSANRVELSKIWVGTGVGLTSRADSTRRDPITLNGAPQTGADGKVVFSPDGKRLAIATFTAAWVWDTDSGQIVPLLRENELPNPILYFSADGRYLLAVGSDGSPKVYDRDGKKLYDLPKGHRSLAFSPDGKRLVVAGGNGVTVLDASTRAVQERLQGARGPVAYRPDGKQLFTTGESGNEVKVWDAADWRPLRTFAMPGGRRFLQSPNAEPREKHRWEGGIHNLQFSPDGKFFQASDIIFHSATGREKFDLTVPDARVFAFLGFSADGKRLVTCLGFDKVSIWDVMAGQTILELPMVVISHEGNLLLDPECTRQDFLRRSIRFAGDRLAWRTEGGEIRVCGPSSGE